MKKGAHHAVHGEKVCLPCDEILLSIHRLDDESKMLTSWQLRSSREREFHLFQSVVIVKLRFHFTNGITDMRNENSYASVGIFLR